jgi:hypothetical protein
LAIAHTVIVKKHGGALMFESEIGKGSTFIVRLPTVPPSATGPISRMFSPPNAAIAPQISSA